MITIGRRRFLATAAIFPLSRATAMANKDNEIRLYVGTYTSGGSSSKGIYLLEFDQGMGGLGEPKLVAETEDPSFLAVSRDGKYLYAVNETLKYEGKDSGYVSAFAIDKKAGYLKLLNRQPSHGAAPCHITLSDRGDLVLVTNYLGGNVAAFPVASDGSLKPASDVKQHTGKCPNAARQEAPHAHSVILDGANRFAFVNDLGIDRVVVYSVDRRSGMLTATSDGFSAKPGAGPRHFKFHPSGNFAFLNNELDMTVTSLSVDANKGKLTEVQTLSSLPEGHKQTKEDSGADLHVSSDGRFLYASNRGHDSISTFTIDQTSGRLTFIDVVKTGGQTPRNFALDPTGKFLLAANQNSDSITVFKIDDKTGKLTSTNNGEPVPRPVCLVFAP